MLWTVLHKGPRGRLAATSVKSPGPSSSPVTIAAIVEAAAKRVGQQDEVASLNAALQSNGVKFAWQLETLSDRDWDQLNVAMGLKAAIKSALEDQVALSDPDAVNTEEIPDDLRRFLLIPDSDGTEPKRLRRMSASFLAILTVAPEERQGLVIVLCELLALVSALYATIPLSLFRAEEASIKSWGQPPSLDDGINALVCFSFLVCGILAIQSVILALLVASAGNNGSVAFYRSVMNVFGFLFTAFLFAGNGSTFYLLLWSLFTAAGSPYPFIGVIVLIVGFLQVNLHLFFKFILTEMPLEAYHSPRWWREAILLYTPWLRARWSDAVVKPAAERRAAELRARLGIKFKSDVEA